MTRPWLLALAAAALAGGIAGCDPNADEDPDIDAEAPTPDVGQITHPTVAQTPVDEFINLNECRGLTGPRGEPPTIKFKARFEANIDFTAYQLYAANTEDVYKADDTTECELNPVDVPGFVVGMVGEERTDGRTGDFIDVEYATSLFGAAVGQAACGAGEDLFLCLEARRGTGHAAAISTARAQLSLVVSKPRAPTLTSVTPGEHALNVDWDAPDPGLRESYAVVTRTDDPLDPGYASTTLVRTSPRATATDLRVEGLTNGVVYTVHVLAFNDADNPSDPSNSTTASPVSVKDFWELYEDAQGRDQGGCGTAGAGVLGLLGVVALVALRRRP
jgi:MYXO-CTERM domain-containing protein